MRYFFVSYSIGDTAAEKVGHGNCCLDTTGNYPSKKELEKNLTEFNEAKCVILNIQEFPTKADYNDFIGKEQG